ncbi:hypothetical protein NFK58_12935 [Citrobacter portucalensis]|uniref:hypothetical protein n=1 Tax=Citrobacter portucalensis TaxID=1639133 RepID=UPI002432B6EB|nr:hypothetical protein [Citrobacter portucalensis]WFZ22213.1 hypothetical protein NFK58_12935 [Citrobacter portucalensis]
MTNKKPETLTAQTAEPGKDAVWLTNKTKRPIHIMQRGKDADGNNLENIRLSTMGAVAVAPETLNLAGVKQLLANKSLKKVTEAEAKKLNKAHDVVISQDDDEEDEAEEE